MEISLFLWKICFCLFSGFPSSIFDSQFDWLCSSANWCQETCCWNLLCLSYQRVRMHAVLLLKYKLSGGMLGVVSCSASKGFFFPLGGVRSKCTWERSLQVWRCRHREGFEHLEDGEEEEEEEPYPSKKLCGKILAGIQLLAGIGLAQVFAHFRKRMLRLGAKLQKAKVSGQAWHIYVCLVTLLMLAFTVQHAY